MSASFEELDYCPTPIGALSLRRRRDPRLGEVYEIMLGHEFLMTSAFTESEIALARLGIATLDRPSADVVVGSLGLGYTAQGVLDHENASSLIVVEFLEPVMEWHREGLLPLGADLCGDDRCRFVHGDFFAMAEGDDGFDPDAPGRRFDAILVDIDHSPDALLGDRSQRFYRSDGLRAIGMPLKPGGVFGLWSNDRPDERFLNKLGTVFPDVRAEPVSFHNPLQDSVFTQTVCLARTVGRDAA